MLAYLISTAGFLHCAWAFTKLSRAEMGLLPMWASTEGGRSILGLISGVCVFAFIAMLIVGFVVGPWYMAAIAFVLGCLTGATHPVMSWAMFGLLGSVISGIVFFANS